MKVSSFLVWEDIPYIVESGLISRKRLTEIIGIASDTPSSKDLSSNSHKISDKNATLNEQQFIKLMILLERELDKSSLNMLDGMTYVENGDVDNFESKSKKDLTTLNSIGKKLSL